MLKKKRPWVLTKHEKSLYFIYKDFFYGNTNENSKIK